MHLFTVFILSLFLTIALVPVFKRLAFRMNIVDLPDARKVHAVPMPKTGGISMALGAFVPMLLWVSRDPFVSSVLIGSVIIVVFGLVDDIRPLTARQKILPQMVAALVVIFFGGVRITCLGDLVPGFDLPEMVSIAFTLFVILGVTNAINLADGLDGLAGGISMLSFILIIFLAHGCENQTIALMAVAMAGGIAGFLRYNTHPAILFMGDAGSQLLGFVSVILAIMVTQANTPYARVMALPLIGFPILDTLTVMAERIIKKKSPFSPDKNHFHHRLLRLGFFHTEAVLIIYIIQAVFIAMALVFRFYSDWFHFLGFLILSTVILLLFYAAGNSGWKFRREGVFDTVVKKRLKTFKEKKIFIRLAFGGLRYGFPLLLVFQVFIPARIPMHVSVISLGLMVFIGATYLFSAARLRELGLRFSVYILSPLLIYATENAAASWLGTPWAELNNLGFIALVSFVIMTMNLTRRQRGFKITPMDILVFIVILIFPNLPSIHFGTHHAGMILAKVLVILFSYDVLAGELRGNLGRVIPPMMIIYASLGIRGIWGG